MSHFCALGKGGFSCLTGFFDTWVFFDPTGRPACPTWVFFAHRCPPGAKSWRRHCPAVSANLPQEAKADSPPLLPFPMGRRTEPCRNIFRSPGAGAFLGHHHNKRERERTSFKTTKR